MKDEKDIERDDTQIIGRTEGPFGSDDADEDVHLQGNKRQDVVDDSANGLDSTQVRGGQDGRNSRGFGGIDMDSKNGVLRMGDQDNSTMEVTDEGLKSATADQAKTDTAMVNVTTSGPDDYASTDRVGIPKAQEAAKQQNDSDAKEPSDQDDSQEDREQDVAETGTDLNNKPTY